MREWIAVPVLPTQSALGTTSTGVAPGGSGAVSSGGVAGVSALSNGGFGNSTAASGSANAVHDTMVFTCAHHIPRDVFMDTVLPSLVKRLSVSVVRNLVVKQQGRVKMQKDLTEVCLQHVFFLLDIAGGLGRLEQACGAVVRSSKSGGLRCAWSREMRSIAMLLVQIFSFRIGRRWRVHFAFLGACGAIF